MSREQIRERIRLIVNGKSADDALLRSAVSNVRHRGYHVEVRITWESGDAVRLAGEAVHDDVDVIVAAGGDGTVNEVAQGILAADSEPCIPMAVIPLGTANDFATSVGVFPDDLEGAIRLAATGRAVPIDVGKVNDRVFVNVTSGGIGAEATARTPATIKRALGGAAYSLMGIVAAAKINPYPCRFWGPEVDMHVGKLLLIAVGNGRQCGGGYHVTPHAFLNDGLLDIVVVHDADLSQFGGILSELLDMTCPDNRFVTYKQIPFFNLETERPLKLNLDGEPYTETNFHFEVIPKVLPFVLGADAPLI